jgi:type IX secretion system PorP/SprF family membrane protein
MNITPKVLLTIAMFMGAICSKGQQDPMYTQYIFNLQTINPAYAGSWQNIGFVALSRLQWLGFTGHPGTQTLSFQSPLRNENVGVGLNVVIDKAGLEKRVSIHADYSYQLRLSSLTTLRLGLKGGFTNYSNNLLAYEQYPDNVPDALFQSKIENRFMPNFGLGLYLLSKAYFLSLSLPKVIENKYQANSVNYSTGSEMRQIYFAGGAMMDVSDNLQFKPTFMIKTNVGSPLQYDVSGNFLITEKFWIGAMYRSGDAVGVIAQWIINNNIRLGYAYDLTISDLRSFQSGVHEVMISYEIIRSKRRFISPRNF